MLQVSLVLNLILLVGVAIIFSRAKRVVLLEKLSTFNACVDAITLGLIREDRSKQLDLIVYGLDAMCGVPDSEEIKWRLLQASEIRRVRDDVAADVLGEYGKFAALQTSKIENYRSDVLDYMVRHEEGMPEPREEFGDGVLAGLQGCLQLELTYMYKRKLSESQFRLWGGRTDMPFRSNL